MSASIESGLSTSVVTIKSDADYELLTKLCNQEGKVLVSNFTGSYCAPCKRIYPFYEKMANISASSPETSSLFVFCKIDIEVCPKAAANAGVSSIPYFLVTYGNTEMGTSKGSGQQELQTMLEKSHKKIMALQAGLL